MRLLSRSLLMLLSILLLSTACSEGATSGNDDQLDNPDGLGIWEVVTDVVLKPGDAQPFDLNSDGAALNDLPYELVPQCDPGEGCFLDPCTENSQCQSGWCVEHIGQGVCAMGCQEECPPGWQCKQVGASDPDIVWLCVSDFANLCKPCAAAADCSSSAGAEDACIAYEGVGAFCGGACTGGKGCPAGFSCEQVTTIDGIELEQCVSKSGTCDCTEKSVALGLWTECEVSNEYGTCSGKRVCVESGLSECDAPFPMAETCNGLDDDCDGLVDEPTQDGGNFIHLCDDENECTEDVCNGAEGCGHLPLSGTPCASPNPCVAAQVCQNGVCSGEAKSCDDGKICTVDLCDPVDGHCSHEAKDANCPSSNNPCVSMVFCDPFADLASDPNQDGCIVLYKPEGTGCNDGDACTSGETCVTLGNNLVCQGTPIEFDDENPCTNDSCDPLTGPKHDAIPDCLEPCEPGELMSGTCGKCGLHSKICPGTGKWSDAEWSVCSDEGDCLPGSQQSILCGNCGFHSRFCDENCQWGAFGECINEGACTPGDKQYEGCEGECTSKARECTEACHWGEWGNCEVTGNCTPGANESQGCGNCGTQDRVCTDFCVWSQWSECGNQGACAAGEVETQACGNCGSQSRTCSETCQWGAWSECAGTGVCSPGQSKEQACGNCGSQTASCQANCQWSSWTVCDGSGECQAGAVDEVSCGDCKVQTRSCSDSCQWGAWSQCIGGGVCTPGQQQQEACGLCGTQTRTCTDSCLWGNWSNCLDQGVCNPGAQDSQNCGNCGTQTRSCSNSCQWTSWSTCLGQGTCSPGAQDSQDCGNCGYQTRSCTNSCSWSSWSSCLGEGVCSPNQTSTQSCGNCGSQSRTCNWSCYWGSWSSCIDPCACECNGGTCCSNGCDYDNYGTPCGGECKQCNSSGSCVNKSNGTNCSLGECYNGTCVECMTGDVEDCDPNCGVFSDYGDGERACSNYSWGVCKPVICNNGNWPVYYPIAPLDHNWHCGYVSQFNMYLCAEVVLSWMCADFLEIRFLKSWNVYGTDETGPWDNDLKVVLRNKSNGKTYTQNKISCAGNTDASGGCSMIVGNSTFTGTLDVTGTDSFEVDIYSPYTATSKIGTTGTFKIKECY